ncbi:unnamed protein product [Dicrocoelium dendriticum]|nr:unnamed protein product [Dicrocoelium dendriticum]
MLNEASPRALCKVLQNLISATLDNIILPLRKEVKHVSQCSDIILLEIQDAEYKTFGFLAQQISAICNAEEDIGNSILREFPKSEACFKCLGINDDTTQGLIRIRGIGFLQLLDMTDVEVSTILQYYGDSNEEIEHVLSGLAKIRANIDLIESSRTLDEDSRKLIKLVLQLTENEHSATVYQPCCSTDGITPPHSLSSDYDSNAINGGMDEHVSDVLATTGVEPHFEAPPKLDNVCFSPKPPNVFVSESALTDSNNHYFPSALQSSPKTTCGHKNASQLFSSAPSTSNCLSQSISSNGYRTFSHAGSPASSSFPWDLDLHLLGGGISVPTTPVWNGRCYCQSAISPPPVKTPDHVVPEGFILSSYERRSQASTINHQVSDRESHCKQAGTPKHRLKLSFPLHRSKSHESNLANRINAHIGSGLVSSPYSQELNDKSFINNNPISSDIPARVAGDHGHDVSACSLSVVHGRHFTSSQLSLVPPSRAISHGTSHLKGDSSARARLGTTNIRNVDTTRRVSYDYRTHRGSVQPPTLMTTSADGDSLLGILAPRSTSGATLVPSSNGLVHRFETESKLGNFVRGTQCAVCSSRMSFRLQHCVNCKVKVHKSCVSQACQLRCVPPIPLSETFESKASPGVNRKMLSTSPLAANQPGLRPAHSTPAFQGCESNSTSSCTSSAPGSPFGIYPSMLTSHSISQNGPDSSGASIPPVSGSYATVGHCTSSMNTGRLSSPVASPLGTTAISPPPQSLSPHHPGCPYNQFDFQVPQSATRDGTQLCEPTETNHLISTQSSAESERTVVNGAMHRFESVDSQDEPGNLMRVNSISVTLKEWDIPMENLIFGDVIGHGTFGTVYQAKWHGEVAVKRIDLDPEDLDGSCRLEAFKREVALLHKTRHENLVLFMGACMKPPDLAIVTQLSQGETLYHLLHHRDTSMAINRTINIASQIAKGMGYLHAKGIVHRDLKTRNIFVEANSRVVIGDFGVFNYVRLYKRAKWGNYLNIPPFWLCYVAPEVIHALNMNCSASTTNELPLTPSSDVFAFGTVWYELLTNEFPFKGYPTEAIIYLSGRGVKQTLRIPGPKDFKEILVQCWAYCPSRRPEFTTLVKLLDRLPKLHRSPSYPVKPTSCLTSGSHDSLLV